MCIKRTNLNTILYDMLNCKRQLYIFSTKKKNNRYDQCKLYFSTLSFQIKLNAINSKICKCNVIIKSISMAVFPLNITD